MDDSPHGGPLHGLRVVEIGGIGPNPYAGMLLADLGADVIRLDRAPGALTDPGNPTLRGRPTITVDLKQDAGRGLAQRLAAAADVLIEGFRPGVMERLGLGPQELMAANRRLVYGRVTGYGQTGPYAQRVGHDVNYLSVAGVLGASRRVGERPLFALNLVGDYAGGTLFLVVGVLAAVRHAERTGHGQVVDAAMVDGAVSMTALIQGLTASGAWNAERPGTNLLDSGAHFYEVYACARGGHIAVGAIEPPFYARLLELLGIEASEMPQFERARWPEFKQRFAELFATRTAQAWGELLEEQQTCVTVVREPAQAHLDPHLAARQTFVELDGVRQPAPAPRLSVTPAAARPARTEDADAVLARWGLRGNG